MQYLPAQGKETTSMAHSQSVAWIIASNGKQQASINNQYV